MSLPQIAAREEWLTARKALLEREKELTRARDALSAERRRLPMVEVVRDYRFTAPDGEVGLLDLFGPYRQLVVQHFMFDPRWESGCPSCSATVDEMSPGLLEHLHARQTEVAWVARAPIEKLERYRVERGWPWRFVSSYGTTFNEDFGVTVPAGDPEATFNFRTVAEHVERGTGYYFEGADGTSEQPGFSCFLRDEERVFHTYSTFARGGEWLGGSYAWLDLTALGRQEDWEEPKGRADAARAPIPDFAT